MILVVCSAVLFACGDLKWSPTIASVQVLRPAIEAGAAGSRHPLVGEERLPAGSTVWAGEHAQAVIHHDGGARLLLDGATEVSVDEDGARLVQGRLWVEQRPGAQVAIALGDQVFSASGSGGAGFELLAGGAAPSPSANGARGKSALTVLRGEVAFRAASATSAERGAERGVVHAGEQATLDGEGGHVKIAPVVLWDDWTGGLGWPDSRKNGGAPGLGEVGARRPGDLGEARFPLSIQRLQVRARIADDLAITTVEQTFFNPASATLEGIYRVRIPQGAILSRFAIDRHGSYVDGYVKERETARREYQEKVYEGSTHDPALLEWEAPGSYRARLYPLPPGATRRVLVTYSEWLPAHGQDGTLRTYRYPMAAAGGQGAPVIQELDIEVDASHADASEVRPGLGATVPGGKRIVLSRTDYVPSADLVVELLGAGRDADTARVYQAEHRVPDRPGAPSARKHPEDDYVLLRAIPVPAPAAAERTPLDLVLLVDLSAATDATHLAMARTFAEAALRRLTPQDRVTLLGADLDLHDLAPAAQANLANRAALPSKSRPVAAPLSAATPEQVQRLLYALSQAKTGGATDLGTTLSEAAALLSPDRVGAVVYVGDAQPTVGELDLVGLRERLDRLPAPLRLYGVGIGAEADLGLLSGLCQVSAGLAFRVSDRSAAAEAALALFSHLSRPAATRVTVDAGPVVDRVYPRQPVSLLAGEPLTVVARLRKALPETLTVSGQALGQPFRRTFKVERHGIDDTADLRLRWSQARLEQLLQSGASTEEVAELGVRQNLITPFTSFYVPSEEEIGQLEKQVPKVRAAGCARSAPMSAAAPEPAPVVAVSQNAPPPPPAASSESPKAARAQAGRSRQMAKDDADAPSDRKEAEEQAPAPAAAPMMKPAKAARMMAADESDPLASVDGVSGSKKETMHGAAKNRAGDLLRAQTNLGFLGTGEGGGGHGAGPLGGSFGGASTPVGKRGGKGGRAHSRDARGDLSLDKSGALAQNMLFQQNDRAPVTTDDNEQDVSIAVLVGIVSHRPRGCSAASSQPLDERIELWRERLAKSPGVRRAQEVFQDAQRGCELPRWTDRRELLRLMLRSCQQSGGAPALVQLYRRFAETSSEADEQDFLRRGILGEVRTPADLRVVYDGLGLGDEEQTTLVREVVRVAKDLPDRLRRIEALLGRWPGNLWLKLARMEAQELLGDKEAARRSAEEVRIDPYADAQARTAVGEFLLRQGDEAAARRAFSEIVEFAPRDPLARRRLGDLYRAHGWFDEAYRQYETLLLLSPADPSVLILQAAAAAGAGHIEESLGLLQRITGTAEPGSESGLSRVALVQSDLRLLLLRDEARQKKDAEEQARLLLRARRIGAQGLFRPVRVLLTWAHPEADLELMVAAPGEPLGSATELAPQFGLLGWDSDQQAGVDGPYQIEVRRGGGVSAALRHDAELLVVLHEGEKDEKLLRLPLQIGADQPVLRFTVSGGQVEVRR